MKNGQLITDHRPPTTDHRLLQIAVLILVLSGGICIKAQAVPATTPDQAAESARQIRASQEATRRFKILEEISNPDNSGQLRPPQTGKVPLTKRDKQLIAMDDADKTRFAAFLKSSDTGFVRLFNADDCEESGGTIDAAEPCPWNVPGKATFYSFRTEDYSVKLFSDVQFEGDQLKITGVNLLGFLTNLGDIKFEELNLASPGVKEMAEFEPSAGVEEVKKQFVVAQNGFQVGNYIYKTALPVKTGATFALRAIAYESEAFWKIGQKKVNLLKRDKRKDVILVFQVIRQHDDGSISILWKRLREKPAPKLN